MQMEIELVEALCGFQKAITTLDSRSLVLTCIPGTYAVSSGRHLCTGYEYEFVAVRKMPLPGCLSFGLEPLLSAGLAES